MAEHGTFDTAIKPSRLATQILLWHDMTFGTAVIQQHILFVHITRVKHDCYVLIYRGISKGGVCVCVGGGDELRKWVTHEMYKEI